MKTPVTTLLKRGFRGVGLLLVVGFVSGCQTTFRTVDQNFMASPAKYRRVQVLPVWFAGAGSIDQTLSTNDLQVLCRQAGAEVLAAVQNNLSAKGYEIVGPVRALSDSQSAPRLGAATLQQLELVRIDFCQNLLRAYACASADEALTFQTNSTLGFSEYMSTWSRARLETNPFHYRMTEALTNVVNQVGATNPAAVLLVDTKVFFESDHNQTKRGVWNWTGGGLLAIAEVGVNAVVFAAAALAGSSSAPPPIWVDPFWRSSNSIQHNLALVNARTGEVLWLNRRDFKRQDPRDAEKLMATVADTLEDLPNLQNQIVDF